MKGSPEFRIMQQRQDHSLGNGVFYAREDCRGVRARVVILVVDLIVLTAMCIALAFAYAATDTDIDNRYYIMCGLISVGVYGGAQAIVSTHRRILVNEIGDCHVEWKAAINIANDLSATALAFWPHQSDLRPRLGWG